MKTKHGEAPHPTSLLTLNAPLNESSLSSIGRAVVDGLEQGEAPVPELTELLSDPEAARIALYLPTSWLPARHEDDCRDAYRGAWWNLLRHADQRADFVDGDIGERSFEAVPRPLVVKAAHLTPSLLEAGVISHEEASRIRQETDSSLIRDSFNDALLPSAFGQEITPLRRYLPQGDESPARAAWLDEMFTHTHARHSSLEVRNPQQLDAVIARGTSIQSHIALRALSRLSRQGFDTTQYADWMRAQLTHDDALVRDQARATFRHLAHGGIIGDDELAAVGVDRLKLSGNLSENIQPLVPELLGQLEQLAKRPELAEKVYPLLLVGGSRLKGYANTETSDVDTAVLVRPNTDTTQLLDQLSQVFTTDMPLLVTVKETQDGLRIADNANGVDDAWSHLVYSMAWLGDEATVSSIRGDLTKAYQDDGELRTVALRRLEQDSLQYRLMHRGYERHYPVRADDIRHYPDALDSHSTYWDEGYRRLATRLFIEKVRLPDQT